MVIHPEDAILNSESPEEIKVNVKVSPDRPR